MILSRIWYLLLALAAGASLYIAQLAVGQYNRQTDLAASEQLKSDVQVVGLTLQLDSRRRLDGLIKATTDKTLREALKAAATKDQIPVSTKSDAKKALQAFNDGLPADYKFDTLFAVDHDGRTVTFHGVDIASGYPDFEVGGYPAVFDALHGFLRDDTWVFGGKIYRVVARPVEDEVGSPPLGAVVGLKQLGPEFALDFSKRTRTNVVFFSSGQRVASGALGDDVTSATLEQIAPSELAAASADPAFKDQGRSELRPLGDDGRLSGIYARINGDAQDVASGYLVVRAKNHVSGFGQFLSSADDADKKQVKISWVALTMVFGSLLGLLFTFLEYNRPLGVLRLQAAKLKKGDIDTLELAQLGSAYRAVADDINSGIERVVEKGGGLAKKPADLEKVLGPVPVQPAMSAFAVPGAGGDAGNGMSSAVGPAFSSGIGPAMSSGIGPAMAPPPARPFGSNNETAPKPPAPKPPLPGGKPPVPKPAPPAPISARSLVPSLEGDMQQEEESTRIGEAPSDLLQQTRGSEPPQVGDVEIFNQYVAMKQQCGEPTAGLTLEKFKVTLDKYRDTLTKQHNCRAVRFSVYAKDGKAQLKASPVR